jgi:Tol biopolymer transport system component
MKLFIAIILLMTLLAQGVEAQPTPLPEELPLYVLGVAWSHDGSKIAAVGVQPSDTYGYVRVFEAETGEVLYELDPEPGGFTSVAWSPDDRYIAAVSYGQEIRVIDVVAQEFVIALYGHQSTITGVDWNPNGSLLVTSGNWDGQVILWDMSTYEQIRIVQEGGSFPTDVAFSPDGKRIAVGGESGLSVYATDPDNAEGVITLTMTKVSPSALAWSPDGSRIAFGTQTFRSVTQPDFVPNSTVYIIGSQPGTQAMNWMTDGETVTGIDWNPDGKRLATINVSHDVKIWDAESGDLLEYFADSIPDQPQYPYNLSFSPDGKQLAYGGFLSADAETTLPANGAIQDNLRYIGHGAVRIATLAG